MFIKEGIVFFGKIKRTIKIVLKEEDIAHLKIKLSYEGIPFSRFFSECVYAVLDKNTEMYSFITFLKKKLREEELQKKTKKGGTQFSVQKEGRRKLDLKLEQQEYSDLTLTQEEKRKIFDIIEE